MRADAAAHHATVTSGNAPNNLTVSPFTIFFNCNISTFISSDLRIYQEHVNKLMATLRNSFRSIRLPYVPPVKMSIIIIINIHSSFL